MNREKKMNREKNVRCQREKLHVCRFGAWTLSNPQSELSSGLLRIDFPLISQIRFDVVFYQIYTLYTGVETTKKKKSGPNVGACDGADFSDTLSFLTIFFLSLTRFSDELKRRLIG